MRPVRLPTSWLRLRLRERQEYEFKPLDWGNLFHRAMEHFARKAEILSVSVTEITDEMRRNLVEEVWRRVSWTMKTRFSTARNGGNI